MTFDQWFRDQHPDKNALVPVDHYIWALKGWTAGINAARMVILKELEDPEATREE